MTPAAGFVTPRAALVIGAVAAPLSLLCHPLPPEPLLGWFHGRLGLPRHGQQLGNDRHRALCHPGGERGRGQRLFFGNPAQLALQALATVVTMAFAFGMTFAVAKSWDMSIGLKVTPMEEEVGLDISTHGERAYS